MTEKSFNWRLRVWGALFLLLAVACVARVAWELLSALVVPLMVLLAIGGLYWLVFGRNR